MANLSTNYMGFDLKNPIIASSSGLTDSVEKIVDGKVVGLNVVKCTSVFDQERRFSPKFDESDTNFFEGDMVVESIGQGMDLSYISGEIKDNLKLDPRGRIVVDNYYQSSIEWLFVGGDIIKGPDVINGIANGHKAAMGIDKYLNSKK